MANRDNVPDEVKDMLAKMVEAHPEYVEKFGHPLDENDPRNWTPSERKKKGVSVEDRLAYLELDVEGQTIVINRLTSFMLEQQKAQMLEELKRDPEGFVKRMLGQNTGTRGAWGPDDDPNGSRYAGSTEGIRPDQMVPTVDGQIRADQIPGYRNDPSWRPSPDWVDANCTCPTHVAQRQANNQQPEDNGNNDFPTGFYL